MFKPGQRFFTRYYLIMVTLVITCQTAFATSLTLNPVSIDEAVYYELPERPSEICFSLWVPSSGVIFVGASTLDFSRQLVVEPLGKFSVNEYSVASHVVKSETHEERGVRMLHQTLNSFQLAVPKEGEQVFCVYLQDRREGLSELKLVTRFVEISWNAKGDTSTDPWSGDSTNDGDPLEEEIIPDPKPSPRPAVEPKDGDPLEEEIIPDPSPVPQPIVVPMDGDPLEEEIIPDPSPVPQPIVAPMDGDPLEEEIIPDPSSAPIAAAGHFPGQPELRIESDLCHTLKKDDHSDWSVCASHLFLNGEVGSGRLQDYQDNDYFTFSLERWQAVSLDLLADMPVALGLYDVRGQLLAKQQDLTSGQLVRTLSPGRYYVRLLMPEGAVSPSFALALRSLRD